MIGVGLRPLSTTSGARGGSSRAFGGGMAYFVVSVLSYIVVALVSMGLRDITLALGRAPRKC